MYLLLVRRLLLSLVILVAAWLLINFVALTNVTAESPTPIVTER